MNNIVRGNRIGTNAFSDSLLGNRVGGVFVANSSFNTIGGTDTEDANIISGNESDGVAFRGPLATQNQVLGNIIGPAAPGSDVVLSNFGSGVSIVNSSGNVIGGSEEGAGNVIGLNQIGVSIVTSLDPDVVINYGSGPSDRNTVQGNFIGTDRSGASTLGNAEDGVYIANSSDNQVGGAAASAGNVISGNQGNGVLIGGSSVEQRSQMPVPLEAKRNRIQGNRIGTNPAGTAPLLNSQSGVSLSDGMANTIGGAAAGEGNLISGNAAAGVLITNQLSVGNLVQGNIIGLDISGVHPLGNGSDGVSVTSQASGNTVGGPDQARNVISSNIGSGVSLSQQASGNVVAGNYLGTDGSGQLGLGNILAGVSLSGGAVGNTIGGTDYRVTNVIARNAFGVFLSGAGTSNNQVQGNLIGTDRTGRGGRARRPAAG